MTRVADATIAEVVTDPHYLLHRIDPVDGLATFIPTTQSRLDAASFLDGRTDFSAGPAVTVALDALLAHRPPRAQGPNRMIFHVAFCGSTLLARLLGQAGTSHVLKEPDVLVNLADWKRTGADARFGPALHLVTACLRRRWADDEVVIVKPTNWINNLVDDLSADPAGLVPLFITMERRAYAIAVVRGGRDRLSFAARTAAHLAPSLPEGPAWLQSAIASSADPIGRAVNLALVALHLQQRLFGDLGAATLDFETIVTRPAAAAQRASDILDLHLDPERIAAATALHAAANAKQPDRAFSASDRAAEDDVVMQHHGATIDAALGWADRSLA